MLLAALATAFPARAADQPASNEDRRVCRAIVSTGSRMARSSECHRASEWAAIDKKREEDARTLMNDVGARGGRVVPGGGAGGSGLPGGPQ